MKQNDDLILIFFLSSFFIQNIYYERNIVILFCNDLISVKAKQ